MKINRDKSKGSVYIDDMNMLSSTVPGKIGGDVLGRNAMAMCVCDDPKDQADLMAGLKSCFIKSKDKWYVVRYPAGQEYAIRGNSRDHVLKSMASLVLKKDPFISEFSANRARRPSIDMPYTPTHKLLLKGMTSKFWSWAYIALDAPVHWLSYAWSYFLRTAFKFRSARTLEEYHTKDIYGTRTKAQKWLSGKQVILPTFAIFYTAFTVHGLKSERAKKFMLKRVLRHMFEKSNYVGKMLCGELQDPQKIKDYTPSRKLRWSTRLNSECNRDMRMYPEDKDTPGANMEMLMLLGLHENQAKYGAYQALGPKI